MPNIYSQTNCYTPSTTSNATIDSNRNNSDFYINFVKFLSQLESQNKVFRIAYYPGSGALGTGTDYWDTANRPGANSFGAWRIPTSSTRNYEWYFYLHYTTSSQTNLQITANSTPSTVINPFPVYQQAEPNSTVGVYYSAAICYSGSTSFNPWMGTTGSFLSDSKGNPVWGTGSNTGATLVVFPRDNDKYGQRNTQKDMMANIVRYNIISPANIRTLSHFFFDENNFLVLAETAAALFPTVSTGAYGNYLYIGEFLPTDIVSSSLSSSMLPNGMGFCAFSTNPAMIQGQVNTYFPNTTLPLNTNIGYHSAQNIPCGGAFISPNMGVTTMRLSTDTATAYSQNTFLKTNNLFTTDERPLFVYVNDFAWARDSNGLLGIITSPLLRMTYGMETHSVANQRAILGASTTLETQKLSVPWTGSLMYNALQSLYAYYPVINETNFSTYTSVPQYGNPIGPISSSLTMSVSGSPTSVRYDGIAGVPNSPYTTSFNYAITQSSLFVSGGISVAFNGSGVVRIIPVSGGWAQTSSLNFDFSGNKPFSFNTWYQRKDGTSNTDFITYRSHVSGYDFMLFHTGVSVCAMLAPKYTIINASNVQYCGGTSISFSSWGNVGFTYDGTQFDNTVNDYNRVKLYYNGQPVSTSMTIKNLTGSALSGGIGDTILGPGMMSGCLAHSSFWSKALSDAEMLEIYNNRSNLLPPGPGLLFTNSRSGSFVTLNNYSL